MLLYCRYNSHKWPSEDKTHLLHVKRKYRVCKLF